MLAHTSLLVHGTFLAACWIALIVYGVAWLGSPRRSSIRLSCAVGGLLGLIVATAPTVEAWAERSFTGHMLQHLVMIVVAAPLLVLARPVSTVAAKWSKGGPHSAVRRRAASWWRRTGPVLAPVGFLSTLYVTHLTGIYDAALTNRALHDLEHVAYVSVACALWAVVTAGGRVGAPRRVGAVFAVIGGSALLGMVLLSATTPLVPTYARELGVEAALEDQRAAASLMWVGGMTITLPLLVVSVWRWAAAEERVAERFDAARGDRRRLPGPR